MIGKLKGRVDWIGDDTVIIDVNGVGYEVHCSSRVLQGLPSVGEATELWIETLVREDMLRLMGFSSDMERRWYRLLVTVQGVGAKVALAVLGVLKPQDLASAIALGDIAAITQAPGVGKKVAERLVTELKSKAPAMSMAETGSLPDALDAAGAASGGASKAMGEAVSALTNLGYPSTQAHTVVASLVKREGDGIETSALIRLALQEFSKQ